MASPFHRQDIDQIDQRGSAITKIERQLEILRRPPPPIRLLRPCVAGDGIKTVSEIAGNGSDLPPVFHQFVPASGAATRMFSFLPPARGTGSISLEDLRVQGEAGAANAAHTVRLLEHLAQLPFARQLEALVRETTGSDLAGLRDRDPGLLLELMVDTPGLGLLHSPKGLLPFHDYPTGSRTAFEEHLWAAASYLGDGQNPARFHFTVAAEHQESFRATAAEIALQVTEAVGVPLEISFSLQDPATDTIALGPDGDPIRDAAGRLLFRPGGHGSLLANLSRLAAEGSGLVFLKNIDNIAPADRHAELADWKRQLASHLLQLRQKAFELVSRLETESATDSLLEQVREFLCREFVIQPQNSVQDAPPDEQALSLRDRLDRPLRVCGVVVNRGEPGGGPFWVRRQDGTIDGQIVESSQIDLADPEQQSILAASTHFNPVDIVCSLRDRHGKTYDLESFVDPSTSFVASKEIDGQQVKVLERPGLWNGAMADWNTVFVEVPETTFTPVKTLFDLLRPEHQS